jgi:hypothetical protein
MFAPPPVTIAGALQRAFETGFALQALQMEAAARLFEVAMRWPLPQPLFPVPGAGSLRAAAAPAPAPVAVAVPGAAGVLAPPAAEPEIVRDAAPKLAPEAAQAETLALTTETTVPLGDPAPATEPAPPATILAPVDSVFEVAAPLPEDPLPAAVAEVPPETPPETPLETPPEAPLASATVTDLPATRRARRAAAAPRRPGGAG